MLPNVNVGSPLYMSPEALKTNKYSDKSDIWALGVTAFELLFAAVPWQAASEKELGYKMTHTPLIFPPTIILSEEGKDFIKRCLVLEENKRISIEEME